MNFKKIIFHYPGPFYDILDTGEKKRPKKMYEAFCELGYDVFPIVGSYREREEKFNQIRNNIEAFNFIYCENSTMPITMVDENHIPKPFSIDKKLFKLAHNKKIPIGVYYRDLYWKFNSFKKEIGILKYYLSLYFYKNELKFYSKYSDVLFVQSLEFKKAVPYFCQDKIYELPPGGDGTENINNEISLPLQLIYIGSIKPPIYDISDAIEIIKSMTDKPIILNLVIRKSQSYLIKDYYKGLSDNIKVNHVSGKELYKLLQQSHIALMHYRKDKYRKLVKPLKLFEAITFGLPLITNYGTATATFLKQNKFGWIVDAKNDLNKLLNYLISNFHEVKNKRKKIIEHIEEHTWIARAKSVEFVLMNKDIK